MAEVNRRGGFSDRNGIRPQNTEIQLKDFDARTRAQLNNLIGKVYDYVYEEEFSDYREDIQDFLRFVVSEIYAEQIEFHKHYIDEKVMGMISHTIACDDYDEVLDVVEGIFQYWDAYLKTTQLQYYHNGIGYRERSVFDLVNEVFEREYVGYRFLDGIIVPVSDRNEIETIEEGIANKFPVVSEHIAKANALLADRDIPDYENSIKESISAVEALCCIVTETSGSSATLGKMLNKLKDSGVVIHESLVEGFKKLYGYTCDAKGIRHSGNTNGEPATFEEAKYMLVTCSAFVNYVTALYAKNNL